MSTDWEEMDRLDAFGTFGGRVIPYNGVWKIMLSETNCELWSLKTREEAEAKFADAIKKSGYSDEENPLTELARLRADANRYRFIRSGATFERGKLFIAREGPGIIRVTLEYADQLIDEAMGGNGN